MLLQDYSLASVIEDKPSIYMSFASLSFALGLVKGAQSIASGPHSSHVNASVNNFPDPGGIIYESELSSTCSSTFKAVTVT